MNLSGEELKTMRRALKETFPSSGGKLALVVSDADIGLHFDDYHGDYEIRIQKLLEEAVGRYRLLKLLKTAVAEAPENRELQDIAELVGKYYGSFRRVLPDRGENPEKEIGTGRPRPTHRKGLSHRTAATFRGARGLRHRVLGRPGDHPN